MSKKEKLLADANARLEKNGWDCKYVRCIHPNRVCLIRHGMFVDGSAITFYHLARMLELNII